MRNAALVAMSLVARPHQPVTAWSSSISGLALPAPRSPLPDPATLPAPRGSREHGNGGSAFKVSLQGPLQVAQSLNHASTHGGVVCWATFCAVDGHRGVI